MRLNLRCETCTVGETQRAMRKASLASSLKIVPGPMSASSISHAYSSPSDHMVTGAIGFNVEIAPTSELRSAFN